LCGGRVERDLEGIGCCQKCGAVEKRRVIEMEKTRPIEVADHEDAAWFYPK
jgi:hypothetical protein